MKPTRTAHIALRTIAITRKQLQQLSKPELIEIILQLQVRVAELEEQSKRLTGPPKDSTNSSIPPSKSLQPSRANQDGKRGPKCGHQGYGRKRQQPDVTVEVRGLTNPDIGWTMYRFDNGATGVLENAWFLPDSTPFQIDERMEILGTEGSVHIHETHPNFSVLDADGWHYPDTTY